MSKPKYHGKYKNQEDLPNITGNHYENLMNMYSVVNGDKGFRFFNIITSVKLPTLDKSVYRLYKVRGPMPWTKVSHEIYGTQHLWWLICLSNNIFNPTTPPKVGATLRVINPQDALDIVEEIFKQF